MLNKKKNNKGFTLVELLVVIAIIGILAVVAVPALFKNINKAKVADVESDYSAIKSASLSYYADNNQTPDKDTNGWSDALKDHMDSVPTTSSLGGNYTVVSIKTAIDSDTVNRLALKISNAKATKEQMIKLKSDIGASKVYINGDNSNYIEAPDTALPEGKEIYLVLIDNTDM